MFYPTSKVLHFKLLSGTPYQSIASYQLYRYICTFTSYIIKPAHGPGPN